MKLVTMFADFADEICSTPTRYVTKFIDMPMTHILSESSVTAKQIGVEIKQAASAHIYTWIYKTLTLVSEKHPESAPQQAILQFWTCPQEFLESLLQDHYLRHLRRPGLLLKPVTGEVTREIS